jgi:drug/metabolite transporter (DMT)-like permease
LSVLVVSKGDFGRLLNAGGGAGDGLVLLGAMCWMLYTLGGSRFAGWSPLRYAAMTCLPGAVMIALFTLIAGRVGVAHTPGVAAVIGVWPELAFTLVFSSVLAVFAWNAGIQALGPTNGVLFINLVPVTAFAIGVVQGHSFTWAEIAGSGLTLVAVLVNSLWSGAAKPRVQAPVAPRVLTVCPREV